MNLPEEYVISKFYEYGYRVKFNRFSNTYYCACPICREGKSFHKKRRCFYIPKKNLIFCHNCGWSSRPYNWIKQVSQLTDREIFRELEDGDYNVGIQLEEKKEHIQEVPTLPEDCINLFDSAQIEYYKNDRYVKRAISFIQNRRLDVAINKPKAIYISLKDKVHKNRVILPFYDKDGDLIYYQSRTLLKSDPKDKYISKINGTRSVFNIDKIDSNINDIFLFEGPIDACFTKNGVAVGGITLSKQLFSEFQQEQINSLLFFNKIWVLDSQWLDKSALEKTKILLLEGERVFIWPEKVGTRYKDFNEMCVALRLNEIHRDFIKKNTFQGMEGVVKLSQIKK